MKTNLTLLMLIVVSTIAIGQKTVKKINREQFIGQKIKFLRDDDNAHGYMNFGKNSKTYPWLNYNEFNGRTATFINKENDLYTLKLDDNNELIYFKHYSFSDIPNNIGFYSILDSARSIYLNKEYYNSDLKKCKIVAIEFAEDNDKFSQLHGPYNIYELIDKDTIKLNIHFSETYGPENGYKYEHEKSRCFENIFNLQNPYQPLTKSNIDEKFYCDVDKIENRKIYIHKYTADKDLAKDGEYYVDFGCNGILTYIILKNGIPKIQFISNYSQLKWLFHSYIKIKIGNTTKQTTPVTGRREVGEDAYVIETNYYTSQTDLEILKWIAINYKNEITVRFYGKDYYKDFELDNKDKLAIKETFDLYNLLKTK